MNPNVNNPTSFLRYRTLGGSTVDLQRVEIACDHNQACDCLLPTTTRVDDVYNTVKSSQWYGNSLQHAAGDDARTTHKHLAKRHISVDPEQAHTLLLARTTAISTAARHAPIFTTVT